MFERLEPGDKTVDIAWKIRRKRRHGAQQSLDEFDFSARPDGFTADRAVRRFFRQLSAESRDIVARQFALKFCKTKPLEFASIARRARRGPDCVHFHVESFNA